MGPFSWRRSWTFLGILALSIAPAAQQVSAREALGTRTREASVPAGGGGPGTVVSELQISNTTGGLPDTLDDGDRFGAAVAALGDLDGDGVEDVAVAAPSQTWIEDRNAVWVLFLDTDGSVKSYAKIHPSDDAFGGDVTVEDGFGTALARVGDLDGDGVPELAAGAPTDDDGGSPGDQADRGAVWILFLHADGTLKSARKISALAGGFAGPLAAQVQFGSALAGLGDLDGDGTLELAVGAPRDNDGGPGLQWRGAVWVLSLASDGSVAAQQKISDTQGGFGGTLDRGDVFGSSLAALGDVDGDGTSDLAAGSPYDSDGVQGAGATWVLFLEPDGQVKTQQKISATQGGFTGALGQNNFFGSALAAPGDLDGNGVSELAVGAPGYSQGTSVWMLFLGADGVVDSHQRITSDDLGLAQVNAFGSALAALGDLDGDGVGDLAAGEPYHGTSFHNSQGEVLTLFVAPAGTVKAAQPIDGEQPSFPATLDDDDFFGCALADLGDLDGDGISEVVVGASGDDEAGFHTGALYVLYPNPDGSVRAFRKIAAGFSGFDVTPGHQDHFGAEVVALGDLDGDGISELAVGAPTVAGEDVRIGSVWVLFLAPDGTVRTEQRISAGIGGFTGDLDPYDAFGASLAALGDLDGDGIGDLAAGGGGFYYAEGKLWILFLASDGTVKSQREITPQDVGFAPWTSFYFGGSLETLGDLDSDGIVELGVASGTDPDDGMDTLSILFLRADGTVRARTEIGAGTGGFTGVLDDYDFFAGGLAALCDLDGDGVDDVAVGAAGDDDGASPDFYSPGAAWILFLRPDGTVKAQQKISALEGNFTGPLGATDFFGSALANLGDLDGDGLAEIGVGAFMDDDGGEDRGALWRLGLDGVATVDFDHGDDQARSALANGLALPGTAFTRTLTIASAGANLGAAIFDSRPDGPNALGADPDLLVDLGNLLVLQDSAAPAQSVPGIFDSPGDDPEGGLVTIGFRAPVQALSLVLVDIDGGHGQGVKVALTDVAGRMRVYEVPAGWTGDRLVDGTTGYRTLDLSTLAPQPGHASTAVASQDRRFDARRVTTLRVAFASSGAIAGLQWDPYPLQDGVRSRPLGR